MKTIVIKRRHKQTRGELIDKARKFLEDGIDTGDDDVLDVAIQIAHQEGIDVVFKIQKNGKTVDVKTAYGIRYERGLDLR